MRPRKNSQPISTERKEVQGKVALSLSQSKKMNEDLVAQNNALIDSNHELQKRNYELENKISENAGILKLEEYKKKLHYDIESLEKQHAEKFKYYKENELGFDRAIIDAEASAKQHILGIHQDIDREHQKLKELQAQSAEHLDAILGAKDTCKDLSDQSNTIRDNIKVLSEEKEKLIEECSSLKITIDTNKDTVKLLEKKITDLNSKISALENQLKKYSERIQHDRNDLLGMEEIKNVSRETIKNLEKNIVQLRLDIITEENKLKKAKEDNTEFDTQLLSIAKRETKVREVEALLTKQAKRLGINIKLD